MARGRRTHLRWWIVVLAALVGAAAGGLIGARRQHTYSSTATMSAGPIAALSSAEAANTANDVPLASDYARLLTTDAVANRVAARLHTSAGYVRSHLSAAAETGTPLFDVSGQGPTAASARRLTASATSSLRDYVDALLASQRTQPQLLTEYQQAEQRSNALRAKVANLQASLPVDANTATLQQLQSQLAVAQLRVQGLASMFMQGDQTTSISQDAAPTMVAAPQAGVSTARKKTAEFAAVGLIAGLCLGISLLVLPGAVLPGSTPPRTDDVRLGRV